MSRDSLIVDLIRDGRLRVEPDVGLVFAPRSNTPSKPVGARTAKGYLRLCITVDGSQLHFMVHRIVWAAVNGPVPDGYEVDHKNTIKTDNRIANLEAVPGLENMRRAAHAGRCRGNGRKDGIRDSKGRFGKKAAGRVLDGREWNEFPGEATAQ